MSQLTDNSFVERCHRAVLTIKDPVELQRTLTEMVEAEFPVVKPVFTAGETLAMHEFLSRYQRKICGGVVPAFYSAAVTVTACNERGVALRIELAEAK